MVFGAAERQIISSIPAYATRDMADERLQEKVFAYAGGYSLLLPRGY